MLLIADSGSTKTDWCLVDKENRRKNFSSSGMNPYNTSEESMRQEIESVVCSNIDPNIVTQIVFYGAGCSSDDKKRSMKQILSTYFVNAKIEINHDLLGAARALCGNQKGICAILGTGSNSCLYDGIDIIENIPALGYVLCDEGAGTNIGKIVLRDYLRNLLPIDLSEKFSIQYPGDESDFLNRLYKGSVPNYYLASFAKFAIENKEHEYIKKIITNSFASFFDNQIVLYSEFKTMKINVIGSVGYLCRDIFCEVANNYGMKVGKIIKAPLKDLVDFHTNLI